MNVATSGLTSSTPTLAKIAVNAANTADSKAQNCQTHRHHRSSLPLPLRQLIAAICADRPATSSPTFA